LFGELFMKRCSQPTIRDVAAMAGVSVATVSKFVNDVQRFSPEVESRLKEAIEKLRYRSNPLARSMITGRTRTIGVVVPDIANPHFTSVVKGANKIALLHDYTLLLVDTEENATRERSLIQALAPRVDGLIISSRASLKAAEWMQTVGKPIVVLSRVQGLNVPHISFDNRLATYMLAQHLLALGHKHIAYLGFSAATVNEDRILGAQEAVSAVGATLDVYDVSEPTSLMGEQSCSRMLLGPRRPHAVICYNDLLALGFMKEAKSLGFRLPSDLSVAGIDNVPYGEYVEPRLTTVDTQSIRMGESAMLKLVDVLDGPNCRDQVTLEPRIVVRDSTAERS
jgi:LacI family transcriptional regulator